MMLEKGIFAAFASTFCVDILSARDGALAGEEPDVYGDARFSLFGLSDGDSLAAGDSGDSFLAAVSSRQGAAAASVPAAATTGPLSKTIVGFMLAGMFGQLVLYSLTAWRFKQDRRWIETVASEFK